MEEGKTFVSWEEVVVSNDKGRREVHYYLRDAGGGADLAVVGKERSIRHMSYAVPGRFLRSLLVKPPHLPTSSPSSSPSSPSAVVSLKWKTRREVVDWLSSLVSDSISYGSSPMMDRFTDDEGVEPTEIPTSKGLSSGKMGHHSKEFSWLGSAWNCKKRRMHYRSFCRNGVSISVHDFVYVMAEENKRLIAYVEDLYEDPRANNMVVVRWFHKVDEVGILLPADVNAREIFFSLCLQDLSVECIDGLAVVLSAQHFEKFLKESKQSIWEPYLCRRQIDNDYIKPLDITQVQGYWSQELLRSLYSPSLKLRFKISCAGNESSVTRVAPKKDHLLINRNMDVGGTPSRDMNKAKRLGFGSSKAEKHVANTTMASPLLRKELFRQKLRLWPLAPGCQVEVLSQNSGMRGCWFRCVVLKRQHDKVKVRYQDVQDADEAGNLEEWLVSSRVASPDKWGIRLRERPILRPNPSSRGTDCFDVGAVVDAWWHDGWWEGLVILKESEGKHHVYFPGEQQVSIFCQSDLRHSQDWVGNTWNAIKDRPDVASSLSSLSDCKNQGLFSDMCITQQAPASVLQSDTDPRKENSPHGAEDVCKLTLEEKPLVESDGDVLKLAKVCQLDHVNWSSLRRKGSSLKRKRKCGSKLWSKYGSSHKRRCDGSSSSSSQEEAEESNGCGDFVLPKSLTVDHENCKIGGDHPLFGAPMTLCSNLVMSM